MSDCSPYKATRASLSLEHCYWASLLAVMPWLYALGWDTSSWRLMQKLQREGLLDLAAELGGIVVWTQCWITGPVVWMMVLFWGIRTVHRISSHGWSVGSRGQAGLLVLKAPEWVLTCSLAAAASTVLLDSWLHAAFGGPEVGLYPDPGNDQSGSGALVYFAVLLVPAVLCITRPWVAFHAWQLVSRAADRIRSGARATVAVRDGDVPSHGEIESRARERPKGDRADDWARRFYEHAICTLATSCVLAALGPKIASHILNEILQPSTSLPVAVLWLQGLVMIPLAWAIAAGRGAGWIWRLVVRGSAARRLEWLRRSRIALLPWLLTCTIGAAASAKIGISGGFFSIDSVNDAELRRQVFLEVTGIAILPTLLQLGMTLLTTHVLSRVPGPAR